MIVNVLEHSTKSDALQMVPLLHILHWNIFIGQIYYI